MGEEEESSLTLNLSQTMKFISLEKKKKLKKQDAY